jgi:large subunit ribosomal protein L1
LVIIGNYLSVGKTKTVLVTGDAAEEKSGKAAYEEKKRKQMEAQKKAEAEKAKVTGLGLKGGERIKIVGGEVPAIEEVDTKDTEVTEATEKKKARKVKVRSKKYKEVKTQVDRNKLYALNEAIETVKKCSYSKFDGTMELHLVVKKANLSAQVTLPHSAGKAKTIEIANDKTVENLKKSKVEFDILLATADMMPKLVPFAKILGPKGLMPNPKNGTLIKNAKEAEKFSGNSMSVKTEKSQPVIHTVVGKVSQSEKELKENIEAILDAVSKKQILKAFLKSTMSPSVKLSS